MHTLKAAYLGVYYQVINIDYNNFSTGWLYEENIFAIYRILVINGLIIILIINENQTGWTVVHALYSTYYTVSCNWQQVSRISDCSGWIRDYDRILDSSINPPISILLYKPISMTWYWPRATLLKCYIITWKSRQDSPL